MIFLKEMFPYEGDLQRRPCGEIEKDQELHVIRHTAAHVMAQAIKRLHPQAKFAYGPGH